MGAVQPGSPGRAPWQTPSPSSMHGGGVGGGCLPPLCQSVMSSIRRGHMVLSTVFTTMSSPINVPDTQEAFDKYL